MSYDVIIVGAGPGGLACAEITASRGLKTLILERKQIIGKKVCAGGVTWSGLNKKIPIDISERQFATQYIFTRCQKASVSAPTPIIATVNRIKLGQQMSLNALEAGAEIRSGCQVLSIKANKLTFIDKTTGELTQRNFTYLVGADGSTSLVRRHLGLPVRDAGIGINYQIPGNFPKMEWHLSSSLFKSGYAWVFPHKETVSVGAYVDCRVMKAKQLQQNLLKWGQMHGYSLSAHKAEAEFINYDFRGYRFDNTFLVGDAAGLASGLTGEGIYPAIISGESVARCITAANFNPIELEQLIKNHNRHRRMVSILGKSGFLSFFLAELVTLCLKNRFLTFNAIEMAH